jgi:hypothetical protein
VHAISPRTARELLGRHVNFGREDLAVRAFYCGILRDDRKLSRSRLGNERPVCACGQGRPPFTWCADMNRDLRCELTADSRKPGRSEAWTLRAADLETGGPHPETSRSVTQSRHRPHNLASGQIESRGQ